MQVRLFHRAVVVANNQSGSMRGIVLQLGIDQFENEGRRVAAGAPLAATTPQKFSVQDPAARGSLFNMAGQELSIHRRVIQELLRPHDWCPLPLHLPRVRVTHTTALPQLAMCVRSSKGVVAARRVPPPRLYLCVTSKVWHRSRRGQDCVWG